MANEQTQPQKVKIKISQILEDLGNGVDRKGIRAKYGLSATDVARLFQDPKLKGARVKTAPAFELEDDVPEQQVKTKAAPAGAKEKTSAKKKVATQPAAQAEEETDVNETDTEASSTEEGTIREVATEADKVETGGKVKSDKGMW